MNQASEQIRLSKKQASDLGKRIQQRRFELSRIPQQTLANDIALEQPRLSKIERGHARRLKRQVVERLASALETSVEWLLTGEQASNRVSPVSQASNY